jgi:hypothetical protein
VGGPGGIGGPGGVGGVGGPGRPGGPGGPGGPGSPGNRPGGGNNRPGGGNNIGNGNGNTIITNPGGGGCFYGWNGGMAWAPVPYYWGGGFWGAMAIGVTSAAVYGAFVDEDTHTTYNSYEVQSGTPGQTFLDAYQLVQVKCGPPNLVVVYGPENSVICANPNQNVGEGEYQLDTATLNLISMNNTAPQSTTQSPNAAPAQPSGSPPAL